MNDLVTTRKAGDGRESEEGFLLVGVIVMVALVLLLLSIAAPVVAKDLRRERELEAVHRGQQYTRAIRLFYLKFNTYPASIEALEKTNNVRYLRQRYVDPMTGKPDWKLIHFGQAKTTVKGFFGQPLSGLGGAGSLGSASGLASSQQPGQSAFGGQAGGISGGQSGIQGAQGTVGSAGGVAGSAGGVGTNGATGTDPGSSSFGSSSFGSSSFGSSSSSGGGLSGGGGPFVGIGIPKEGASIIDLNEQTDYSTWEFIYDPRIEQLYGKVSLFGGGPASTSSGSLGSASSLSGLGSGGGASGNNGGGVGNGNGGNGNNGNSNNGNGNNGNGNNGPGGTTGTGSTPQQQ